jgi:hypothetical protein
MRLAAAIVVLVFVGAAFGATGPGSSEWRPRGAILRGDVDGDGKLDAVRVEYRARRSCNFRLAAGSLVARIRPEVCSGKPAEADPQVTALAGIDRRPGLEIVVELGRGAHTEFSDLWTVREGRLRRFAGPEPHISYGGSVGTGSHVVDCARQPGVVLMSTRVNRAQASVVRTWYRAEDLRLRRIRSRKTRWPSEKPVTFREFGYPQPFPSCAKARAAR